jgi:septal ring factor EnvC (AmiA/AmiB activator)
MVTHLTFTRKVRKGGDIMKKQWLAMALIIGLGLSGGKVLAQPATPPPQGEERQMSQERREELRKRVELIWQQKLTEKLSLTEEEKAKVFPLLRQYEEKRRALRQENRQLVRELEQMIENKATERELKKTIRALEENDNKLREEKEEGFHELAKILPVDKQARYIVFQEQFRREMHRLIQRARHHERGPRTP